MRPNQNQKVEPGHRITLTIRDQGNRSGRDGQQLVHDVAADGYTAMFIGRSLGEEFTISNPSEECGMHICPVTVTAIDLP